MRNIQLYDGTPLEIERVLTTLELSQAKRVLYLHVTFYSRKVGDKHLINFPREQMSENDMQKRKAKQYDGMTLPANGKSIYRGVHWQKNRKRLMATRYSLSHQGEKNFNFWAFDKNEHAAMAFDTEARKQARLWFEFSRGTPNRSSDWLSHGRWIQRTTLSWGPRTKAVRNTGEGTELRSVQCNMNKVLQGVGRTNGPVHFGQYQDGIQAAWCLIESVRRRYGVPEKELNFPRYNQDQKEVRLFDDECYFCHKTSPDNPIATPCNHVFCASCVTEWLDSHVVFRGCHREPISTNDLRTVDLIPWQEKVKKRREKKRKRENTNSSAKETPGETARANEIEDSATIVTSQPTAIRNKAQSAILGIQMTKHCWKWEEEVLHVKNRQETKVVSGIIQFALQVIYWKIKARRLLAIHTVIT